MFKKIFLSIVFAALCSVLIYGAINRTSAKTESDGGRGDNLDRERVSEIETDRDGQTADDATTVIEWRTLKATVDSITETEMVLHTASGGDVLVEGRPWSYAVEMGFTAEVGDVINVSGYDEDDEFKIGVLDNITSGQQMEIRSSDGSPMWAGRGGGK
ncbi:MAG: hypothetical protein HY866_06180 [Chloroflexi bacterium]|nr:hypothetical protein [Chloroflexota bacterium]